MASNSILVSKFWGYIIVKSISEREDTSKKVYDSGVAPKLSSRDGFLCYKYVKIIYNYIFKDILTNFADCVEYRVQFHKKHGNNIDNNHLIISKPGEPVIPTERSDESSVRQCFKHCQSISSNA